MTSTDTSPADRGSVVPDAMLLRLRVEDFLAHEAALLDAWQLEQWLELFAPGATYEIPSTDDRTGQPHTSQMLIADSFEQIAARVKRLKSRNAHAENPRSRTRRLLSTAQVALDGELVLARASFVVYRIKGGVVAPFIGEYQHVLEQRSDGALRFRRRRAVLDIESLDIDGRVSIVL